ncbi:MAG TPA: MbnP family protein [Flavobacterium sp.]|nr:MbnP family protein [Flavobacterium sp.]
MVNKLLILVVFLLSFLQAIAQEQKDSIVLSLKLQWKENPLVLNKTYISENKDTLQLHQLKFYLSDIQLYFDDATSFSQKKYHLVDMEDLSSTSIPVCKNNTKTISKVIFSVGVDSTASVSGALGGDLDPAKGMYWAWQSGYINMKIEGSSSSCKTRKNAFHFHVGGYLKPNYALRKIVLTPQSNSLEIIMDVSVLFDNLLLSEDNSVMIPGKKAMEIADKSTKTFQFK